MKLSEFKSHLQELTELRFYLPNGQAVPSHFHVTEIGAIQKHFIDCGGSLRHESKINFQLWSADDIDHRLQAQKLQAIIALSEHQLKLKDAEIEIEYQAKTIGKYAVDLHAEGFQLINTHTDCLAKDKCGIPEKKPRLKLADLQKNSCAPNSGCC